MKNLSARLAPSHAQRGVVLFIALIVIVAMALAGLALVRSVDTNVVAAGNIAFKQSAIAAADTGIEGARTWLIAHKSGLSDDALILSSDKYYSNWQATVGLTGNDPTKAGFNWKDNSVEITPNDGAGNQVRFVIHRLCATSNALPSATTCVKVASTTPGGGASNAGEYGGRRGYEGSGGDGTAGSGGGFNISPTTVYYRITVRVDGPRNTTSYVQALMY